MTLHKLITKTVRRALTTIGIASSFMFVHGAYAASPSETVEAMHRMAESGDWDAFVRQYYGELHKAESEEDIQELVSRFHDRWGEEFRQILKRAVQVSPTLESGGQKAKFELDIGTFMLYKAAEGEWKFHL